jgi:hypothetical protein
MSQRADGYWWQSLILWCGRFGADISPVTIAQFADPIPRPISQPHFTVTSTGLPQNRIDPFPKQPPPVPKSAPHGMTVSSLFHLTVTTSN